MKVNSCLFLACLACALLNPAQAWGKTSSGCGPEPPLPRPLHQALIEAQELFQQKKAASALVRLERQNKDYPESTHHQLSFFRGVLNYQAGNKVRARSDFKKALELRPCFGPALKNLAVIQYELGKPLEAARTALRAFQFIKPPDHELRYQAAVFYLSGNKAKSALPLLRDLAALKPKSEKYLLALIRTHLELGQPAQARPLLKKLLHLKPGEAKLWRLLAGVETQMKNYGPATAAMQVAVRLKGEDKADLRSLAQLYQAAGAPLQAAQYYRRLYGPNPTAKQWRRLARIYLQANQAALAEDAARKMLERGGSKAEDMALLGEIYLRQRKYAQALPMFTKAARRSRGDLAGRQLLRAGYCALRLDLLPQAEQAFNQALEQAKKQGPLASEARQSLKAVQARIRYRRETARQEMLDRHP